MVMAEVKTMATTTIISNPALGSQPPSPSAAERSCAQIGPSYFPARRKAAGNLAQPPAPPGDSTVSKSARHSTSFRHTDRKQVLALAYPV